MPLIQIIDRALEKNVGKHGVSDKALADALARAEGALDHLRKRHADGSLPLLKLPQTHADLRDIRETAKRLALNATDIVILGTGGSSLGGQTLAQLAHHGVPGAGAFREPPRLHFIDNLDADTFAALEAMQAEGLAQRIPDNVLGLTEPAAPGRRNGLRELLGKFHVPMLDHHPGIGGRYSALTNVGLLPAALLGLDIAALRAGAGLALAPVLAGKKASEVPAAVGAALAVALAGQGKTVSVLMAYCDRLERFTHWYVQLWAESLGKHGKGTTPLAALGPVDQHSQVQLFIGGPRDKLFTVVTVEAKGQGPRMDGELARLAGEPGFAGKTIGDLVAAEGRATAETLAKNGCPVRTIHLPRLDEETLGELMMHFMLETVIAAHLLGVDAFDQPAVEEGKVLAKTYLTGG